MITPAKIAESEPQQWLCAGNARILATMTCIRVALQNAIDEPVQDVAFGVRDLGDTARNQLLPTIPVCGMQNRYLTTNSRKHFIYQ
jgi:hypothetical protein